MSGVARAKARGSEEMSGIARAKAIPAVVRREVPPSIPPWQEKAEVRLTAC